MHLFATERRAAEVVNDYPVREYGGASSTVAPSPAGTTALGLAELAALAAPHPRDPPDPRDAPDAAEAAHAFLLSSFDLAGLPSPPGRHRWWPAEPSHADQANALIADNLWLCEAGRRFPQLLPFVTVHPAVLDGSSAAEHVAALAAAHGARGLKLHPIAMRTYPDDPGLAPTLSACAELGLPVLAHSGPDRQGAGWSLPTAFEPVIEAHPDLKLILAHLGGAAWGQIAALAARFTGVRFDLSEIVAWIGAPRAPSASQLVELIHSVGVERVLFGSDYPWYAPSEVAERVIALPGLSAGELDAILGGNAARLAGLG